MIFDDIYSYLSHWYKLDETTGTNIVDSKGSINGTANTTISSATGIVGTCLNFATDKKIDITGLPGSEFQNNFSISLWIKITNTGINNKVIYFSNNVIINSELIITLDPNGIGTINFTFIEASLNNISLTYNAGNILNTWLFITVTVDFSTPRASLYINGTEVVYQTLGINPSSGYGSTNVIISNIPYGVNGFIDNLQFWTKALSKAEIDFLYSERIFTVGLTKYYIIKRYDLSNPSDTGTIVEKFRKLGKRLIVHDDISLLADGYYAYTLVAMDASTGLYSESSRMRILKGS